MELIFETNVVAYPVFRHDVLCLQLTACEKMSSCHYSLLTLQEAAAFVTEGLEHIKFSDHPTEKIASFVYDVVHSTAYRVYHLVVTVALLLLALFEFPTVFLGENSYPTYQSDWLRVSNFNLTYM